MKRICFTAWIALFAMVSHAEANAIPDAYRSVAAAHRIPQQVLYLIARTATLTRLSSGGIQPWPWVITIDGRAEHYGNRQAASRALQRYLTQGGHTLAVGLMQLDWRQHQSRFNDPAQALDPWQNLRLGAAELRRHYRATSHGSLAAARYNGALATNQLSLKAIDWDNQRRFAGTVHRIARRHRLAPELVQAVISVESRV